MGLISRRKEKAADPANGTSYIGAVVLGLNDALVELTGALAGFTMALPNCRLILLAGFTTGVAATLSMAAAEFLSQQTDKGTNSYVAAFYTGFAYLITVSLLLLPFALLETPILALAMCLGIAACIIMVFTWCISRICHTSFAKNFTQMLLLSFSVAFIAFFISWGAKLFWGINV